MEGYSTQTLEGQKALGVKIPATEHAGFKAACASKGVSMRKVLRAFIKEFIQGAKEKKS